jgi:hypothetical protein
MLKNMNAINIDYLNSAKNGKESKQKQKKQKYKRHKKVTNDYVHVI